MAKHYLTLGNELYNICFVYKPFCFDKRLTFTLLHVFKFNFEFTQKHLCYNSYLTLFFQLIRIRPITMIYKHRFEERITKTDSIFAFCLLFEFSTDISHFILQSINNHVVWFQ